MSRRRRRHGRRRRATLRAQLTCPYCGRPATFLPSTETLYHGRDYGPAYACTPCQAWVGCHPGTTVPLGRLADAALRRAKIAAHEAFDAVWRAFHAERVATDPGYSLGRARARAYKRLADVLGIDPANCHLGMFDVETCEAVTSLCTGGAFTLD